MMINQQLSMKNKLLTQIEKDPISKKIWTTYYSVVEWNPL